MRKELLMVGTLHEDFDGTQSLERILVQNKPNNICVEMNKAIASQVGNEIIEKPDYAFNHFQEKITDLITILKDKEVQEVWQKVFLDLFDKELKETELAVAFGYYIIASNNLGFEYKVSKRYAEKNNIPLHLIDLPYEPWAENTIKMPHLLLSSKDDESIRKKYLEAFTKGLPTCLEASRQICQRFYRDPKELNLEKMQEAFLEGSLEPNMQFIANPKRDDYMIAEITKVMQETKDSKVIAIVGLGHLEKIYQGLRMFKPNVFPLN